MSWRLSPEFEDDLLVSIINGAGMTASEIITFPDESGKTLTVLKATFDKRGRLQKQDLYDAQGKLLQTQTNFDVIMPLSVPGSIVYLQTVVHPQDLERRFAISLYNLPIVLSLKYGERGKHIYDSFDPEIEKSRQAVAYGYNAQAMKSIKLTGVDVTTVSIERDAGGKMRALSATRNGLLTRSATPVIDGKGAVIGTRIKDYASGILREVNEVTQAGGAKNSRVSQSSSDKTIYENGQQSNEKKFEFRMDINSPKTPAVAAVEVRKRTLYRNAKIAMEELFRGGVLTQRSEFDDNGVIAKTTDFNADGSVALEFDASKIPYVDGSKSITRRSDP